MKHRIAQLSMWMCLALVCLLIPNVRGQATAPVEDPKLAGEDKDGCVRNLKLIYDAIQAYRVDHKDIPRWLSDLVPQYIVDANTLICPACRRNGQIEAGMLADPKLPCSYLYEFCPVPIEGGNSGAAMKTRREWKRRQMGQVGGIIPIVRCKHHAMVLNLSFDGQIYESPELWQTLISNRVNPGDLTAVRLFSEEPTLLAAPATATYRPRDPQTKAGLIDLTAYYDAPLSESWHGVTSSEAAPLPDGVQNVGGVDFDVRGIIQLGSKSPTAKHFPARINGIRIQQPCSRLHFLQSAGFGVNTDEGKKIGSYILHFAENHMQLEIPIVYGRDVHNWRKLGDEKPVVGLTQAKIGNPDAPRPTIRVFTTTWNNIVPGVELESIDFVSAMETTAPLLIAITAD